MSHKSFKTCNTEEQKIRLRIKIGLKKIFHSWCSFKNNGGKEKDPWYHWARILRKIEVVEYNLKLLSDKKRVYVVKKKLNRLYKKMQPYRHSLSNITKNYGDKKTVENSHNYRKTTRKILKNYYNY